MKAKRPRIVRLARVGMRRFSRRLDRQTPGWMPWLTPWGTSLLLHGGLLLALGLVYYVGSGEKAGRELVSVVLPSQLKDDVDGPVESDHAGDPFTKMASEEPPSLAPIVDPESDVIAVAEMPAPAKMGDRLSLDASAPSLTDPGNAPASAKGAAELSAPFSGRQAATRAKLVRREGGSIHSEKAVERGLDWLARHRRADGSWSLDHDPQCKGRGCPKGKHADSDVAATGLALLPLLGAGQVHTEKGRYQEVVDGGIKWLLKVQRPDGDLFTGGGGNTHMYSHAIATMALSEAYGVTRDPTLKGPTQKAVDFIVEAQNKDDGGWRYNPGEAGDTSVFGWQMFALRSAYLAGFHVPPETIRGCRRYLDRAACDPQKSTYSYQPGNGVSLVMTAEALLGRQYLGWGRESPALIAGAGQVAASLIESESRNIYYWYYGTQLLHNMQGPAWQLWNLKVRDGLVAIQVVGRGCDNGSWDPNRPVPDEWGKEAGRHFVTSLSLLTLEVYYRYLPLYRERDKNPVRDRESADPDAKKATADTPGPAR